MTINIFVLKRKLNGENRCSAFLLFVGYSLFKCSFGWSMIVIVFWAWTVENSLVYLRAILAGL